MSKGRFQPGHKAKYFNLPFISELRTLGYDYKNLPKILGVSHLHYIRLFQEPERMTGKQYIIISQLLSIPLKDVINTLLRQPAKSPHFLTEDYNQNHHIKAIRNDLIEKGVIQSKQ